MNMKIEITQEHIDAGTPMKASYCPIALALAEQFGEDSTIHVWDHEIMIWKDGRERIGYTHSPQSREFSANFDEGIEVSPCTLELEREAA